MIKIARFTLFPVTSCHFIIFVFLGCDCNILQWSDFHLPWLPCWHSATRCLKCRWSLPCTRSTCRTAPAARATPLSPRMATWSKSSKSNFLRNRMNRNESKWLEIPQTDPWEWHFFTLQEHCNTYLYYLILVPLELVLHLMQMFVSYHKDYAWQKLQREEWSVMAHWSLQDRKTPIFLEIAMPSFSGGC